MKRKQDYPPVYTWVKYCVVVLYWDVLKLTILFVSPPLPPFSDYGFKLSEDLSLQVCVPDPEFLGDLYAPPVPCPVGTTYHRSKG